MQIEKIMPPAKFDVLFMTLTLSVKLVNGTGDDYIIWIQALLNTN